MNPSRTLVIVLALSTALTGCGSGSGSESASRAKAEEKSLSPRPQITPDNFSRRLSPAVAEDIGAFAARGRSDESRRSPIKSPLAQGLRGDTKEVRYSPFGDWKPEIVTEDEMNQLGAPTSLDQSSLRPATDVEEPTMVTPFVLSAHRDSGNLVIWSPNRGEREGISGQLADILDDRLRNSEWETRSYIAWLPDFGRPVFASPYALYRSDSVPEEKTAAVVLKSGRMIKFWLTKAQAERKGAAVTLVTLQPVGFNKSFDLLDFIRGRTLDGYKFEDLKEKGRITVVRVTDDLAEENSLQRAIGFLDENGEEVLPTDYQNVGKQCAMRFVTSDWRRIDRVARIRYEEHRSLVGNYLSAPLVQPMRKK